MTEHSALERDISLTTGAIVAALQATDLETVNPEKRPFGYKSLKDGTKLISWSEDPMVLSRRAICYANISDEDYERHQASSQALGGLVHVFFDKSLLSNNERGSIENGERLFDGMEQHCESIGLGKEAHVCIAGIRMESDKKVAQRLEGRAEVLNTLIDTAPDLWLVAQHSTRQSLYAAPLDSVSVDVSSRPPKLVPIVRDKTGNQGVFPPDINLVTLPLHTRRK